MSTNNQDDIKEKNDYIYQRLRTQISKLGSTDVSQPSVFFVFGASVNFYRFSLNLKYTFVSHRVI